MAAAILAAGRCDEVREALRPLLLPGQIKVHWRDERDRRRFALVDAIRELEPVNVVIAHRSAPSRKTERFRRKCLEQVYIELSAMDTFDITLESRGASQDSQDRAHIVALQGQSMDARMRIAHQRGGDEPLLWIPDIVLGAVNSAHDGDRRYLDAIAGTVMIHRTTEGLPGL
ncbi:hypothetical protein [Schumannella sp. 10F1B-5-1]|uniref:hypothetical protein n=1 Tax=Schumannella sp. 10F1B-5-1 TaxID=2590780 RepID=UPI002104315F|nr:hypothetical protein [Schumannella sp. 10F1B-5-1]